MTMNSDAECPFPAVDDVRADRERWRRAHEKLAVDFEKLQHDYADVCHERDELRKVCGACETCRHLGGEHADDCAKVGDCH